MVMREGKRGKGEEGKGRGRQGWIGKSSVFLWSLWGSEGTRSVTLVPSTSPPASPPTPVRDNLFSHLSLPSSSSVWQCLAVSLLLIHVHTHSRAAESGSG